MADYDVLVIGGGPAGYGAALTASERGARVALVEAEQPGGTCVHHACIPTNILLGGAQRYVESREMDVLGVFEAGETFHFGRAVARKDALVSQMAAGIRQALKLAKVEVIAGRAAFVAPDRVRVARGDGGPEELSAEAYIIAAGTRWEKPAIDGLPPERILTADEVQALASAPASAVVLDDGPAHTAFGLEYAVLLAVAGSEVTVVTRRPRLLPGLDEQLAAVMRASLEDLGIRVFESAIVAGDGEGAIVRQGEESTPVAAEIVVAADVRRPFAESVEPLQAGIRVIDGGIAVDRRCETNVPGIYAAGDVTGGAMLSNAATHMGEVAATNATGGQARTHLAALPHMVHTIPEAGWVGLTEEAARREGHDVATGLFDLSYNARALVLGSRQGIVKVVADRELGEVLGVHVTGPEASEILAVAASLMQAEVTLPDLAASVHWHPSIAEGLVQAARRAMG
jgi:dihydrolipoamide dehydrogenase